VLNTQYGKTKGNDMAKILVDELPEIPEQCPFDTTVMAKCKPEWCDGEIEIPVDVCILSRKKCEHTEECEYLKVR
jgi:hypothetical protein